jgi:hypothetical protein
MLPANLKEKCAHFIGQNIPFELVQLYPQPIPEEIQKRIAYWSFPQDEKRLLDYFTMNLSQASGPFDVETFMDSYVITGMLQIGMHIQGIVGCKDRKSKTAVRSSPKLSSKLNIASKSIKDSLKGHSVTVQFDRGRITFTQCSSCESKWCEHIVALCIARIRETVPFELHPPLTETLGRFNRDQLQKMVQHLIERLSKRQLHPVQDLVCRLQDKDSEINLHDGAPDCTAGGFVDDIPLWQADVLVIRGELDKALNLLTQGGHFNCIEYEEFRSTTKKESIFTAFLSRHDENITIALEWAMSVIFDEKVFETETSGTRSLEFFCSMLLPALRVFIVDPFIARKCKKDVLSQLEAVAAAQKSTIVRQCLNNITLAASGCPVPTEEYFKQTMEALSETLKSKSDLRTEAGTGMYQSVMAVLQYWSVHGDDSDIASDVLSLCSVLLSRPLKVSTHFILETVPVYTQLEDGLLLVQHAGEAPFCAKKPFVIIRFVAHLLFHSHQYVEQTFSRSSTYKLSLGVAPTINHQTAASTIKVIFNSM